jgi:hypothetical protein
MMDAGLGRELNEKGHGQSQRLVQTPLACVGEFNEQHSNTNQLTVKGFDRL